jgi:hypothetical protein
MMFSQRVLLSPVQYVRKNIFKIYFLKFSILSVNQKILKLSVVLLVHAFLTAAVSSQTRLGCS